MITWDKPAQLCPGDPQAPHCGTEWAAALGRNKPLQSLSSPKLGTLLLREVGINQQSGGRGVCVYCESLSLEGGKTQASKESTCFIVF